MVVVSSKGYVLTMPCVALTVTELALQVIIEVCRKVVTVSELSSILETCLDCTGTPLRIHPIVEDELVLDGTHHSLCHLAGSIVIVPSILITL